MKWIMAAAGAALLIAGCGSGESDDLGDGSAGDLPEDRTFLSTSVTEGGVSRPLAESDDDVEPGERR
jgi:hypothetical protein